MDKKELQKNIALYYSKLPQKAQEVFARMEWLESLQKICTKYSLTNAQTETLTTETTLVLLGMIHLVEYEKTLTSELNLSQELINKIITEIEDSFLKEIRQQLVETFEKNRETETEQEETSMFIPKSDENLGKLPRNIKDVVKKSNYQTTLYDIAKEYSLNVEQMGILEKEVTNLITGIITPDEFEKNTKNNLKIPLEQIQKLIGEINRKIFLKIRETLKSADASTNIELGANATIMKSAGIEIIPNLSANNELPPAPTPTPSVMITPNREIMIKNIEKPETITKTEVHPMFGQKMSKPFQIPMVQTEHSLDNLSKPTASVPQAPKAYPRGGDPYRTSPED